MATSIHIRWVCNGCQTRIDEHRDLLSHALEDTGEDIYVPDGWIIADQMLFHDDQCYRDWLKRMGKIVELAAFDDGIWIA